jgi:uncharacterized protein with von Willebrand factor type A (vWA) domain
MRIWRTTKGSRLKSSFSQFHKGYKVILVGDARMAYSELFDINGNIEYFYTNDKPGFEWLVRIKEHFPHSVGSILSQELLGPLHC